MYITGLMLLGLLIWFIAAIVWKVLQAAFTFTVYKIDTIMEEKHLAQITREEELRQLFEKQRIEQLSKQWQLEADQWESELQKKPAHYWPWLRKQEDEQQHHD